MGDYEDFNDCRDSSLDCGGMNNPHDQYDTDGCFGVVMWFTMTILTTAMCVVLLFF